MKGVSESWSFYNGRISFDDYMAQKKGFTAANYNAKEWVDLIEQSGAKYTVLTTKHHDGFCLWDTKTTKSNAVKQSPAKRDLIAPFAEEVKKRKDLHLGLYFRCSTGVVTTIPTRRALSRATTSRRSRSVGSIS